MSLNVEVPSLDARLERQDCTIVVRPIGSRAERFVFAHTLAAMLHQEMCAYSFSALVSPAGELVVDTRDEHNAKRMQDALSDLLPKVH